MMSIMLRMKGFTTAIVAGGIAFIVALFFFLSREPAFPIELVDDMVQTSGRNLADTIVIITGATSGIGKALAAELYRRGATVVVASRNVSKCSTVAEEIKAAHPGSTGTLNFHKLDLFDLDTVGPFCDWFKANYPHLTFLVNNAGMRYGGHQLLDLTASVASPQGYDEAFVTNFLGHFLLTEKLLPMITSGGRVVSTSSSYHFQADGSTLRPPPPGQHRDIPPAADPWGSWYLRFFHRRRAYAVSKLAQILHMKDLQRRLDAEGRGHEVQAIAYCPGWVRTNILSTFGPLNRLLGVFALKPQAALLAAMGALFDNKLSGGEMLSNHIPPLVTRSWFPFKLLDRLYVRELVIEVMALLVVFLQARSYGYHVMRSSPESRDEGLARELCAWCEKETKARGYLA